MTENKASEGAFSASWVDEFKDLVAKYRLPGVDVAQIVDWQRKDMEAFTEANKVLADGARAVFDKRNEILRETLAQWRSALEGAMAPDALSKQTDAATAGVQRALTNMQQLAEMDMRARTDAWRVVQERMQANLVELQKLLRPDAKG